ncbi:hypothetical protein NBO_70g0008 [Nosema bombycis CQ1]|uniref:Uncharacterized protein n=1 Tax=Nosema bombycis (strain CQ1 / CVCC 102059) TaxID=578461 RepID=R0MH92_NOSB1|nr:hypothetical protein NBO_70g0008 [Nosema bombycis CQ1]|eukprot:EOB13500.1 hypothetical protein NBO_70g0008 [Nosema bombycis CQ1]
MTLATNKENFITNARTRHKNSYNFFCEYYTHFFTVKTTLESIISTLDDICTCKMNINKYLELLKKGLNKNF